MAITHPFVSAKPDGADPTLVRASNWNAAHTVTSFAPVGSEGHNLFFGANTGNETLAPSGDVKHASWNAAFGDNALSLTTTGFANTAVGGNAMVENTTGYANVAIGCEALKVGTTGQRNVAVGNQALLASTTASFNTAVGENALRTTTTGDGQNTACGQEALYYTTTGSLNTACGQAALHSNTDGFQNVAVGWRAGYQHNLHGMQNTWVGALSGPANAALDTLQNATALGYEAQNTKANQVVLGNTFVTETLLRGQVNAAGLSEYADNAAAVAAGKVAGDLYRTGDVLKVVHA